MLNLFKLLFQFLVVIQVLSILCTGNGKVGSQLILGLLKVFQYSLSTIIKIFAFEFRLVNKLIRKINKHKLTIKQNTNNRQYQKEIRTYNQQVSNGNSNIVDIKSYIKHHKRILKD
ncbi:hypothetical protein G8V07_11590 [Clostridium botulinum D/C]|uniref:hypothetical protein n=1 Tax=Clostridium botulinum TaxID=1491 RepID=UPI001E3E9512|nr:hypothetical protein [Clostridium botulinum]MCD3319525.1 hypothetical protein [Clostridium botulinum D/C]MCD3324390.1 hypothetical protein [Clostridium botulinum D/C]MCD3327818.1 hypothetical protein [Clostridium botulinum D/C]